MEHLVILVGLPAAGKSTIVEDYIKQGYLCLNRDTIGGTLRTIDAELNIAISRGYEKIILDNTYITAESRANVIAIGRVNNYKITCIHLDTSFEDAQYNAVSRMIKRHGKLFKTAQDYKDCKDPNMFPPAALYAARKNFVKPTKAEGFDEIVTMKFVRKHNGYTNKAILVDYDGTIRTTISGAKFPTNPNDIVVLDNRKKVLQSYIDKGYKVIGVSNQSGVAKGDLTHEMAIKCFEKTNELLGLDIEVSFCPHSVPPIVCYCRQPGVGMGIEFIEKYKLDPTQCIMVGDMTSDKTFATRCGFKYVEAEDFFGK